MATPAVIRIGIYSLLAFALAGLAFTLGSVRQSFNARAERAGREAIASEPCLGPQGWRPRGRPRIDREIDGVREAWLLERGAERLRLEIRCLPGGWRCVFPVSPPCATGGNHGI